MGSFVAMAMMGLFPNPGQDVYLITVPFFESVRIQSPVSGEVAMVRTVGYEGGDNLFIQEAWLNGERYTKNWIDHGFFVNGGELVLVLGDKESSWGTGEEDLPPTLSG